MASYVKTISKFRKTESKFVEHFVAATTMYSFASFYHYFRSYRPLKTGPHDDQVVEARKRVLRMLGAINRNVSYKSEEVITKLYRA